MVSKQAPEGAQAVGRAIRLLKSFSRRQPEMSLADLCDIGGLTKTTTHRLLMALESEALVARNPATHLYRLGPALIVLGTRARFGNDLRTVVEPELETLAEIMVKRRVNPLPVVEDGNLVGIVSRSDIIGMMARDI